MPDFSDVPSSSEVTRHLKAWGHGEEGALGRLVPLVQAELPRLAHRCKSRENPRHTLQTTALVNEVYLRLFDIAQVSCQDRAHFFAISARMIRRMLTAFARARNYQKRGTGCGARFSRRSSRRYSEQDAHILALDAGLTELAALYPRQSQVVELGFFGGLEVKEVAEDLKISPETVKRDWRFAEFGWCAP